MNDANPPGPASAGVPAGLGVLAAASRPMTPPEAAAAIRTLYGLCSETAPLHGERDQNFRVETPAGGRFVFKLCNAAEDPAVADFQTQALLHVAAADPDLPAPRVVTTLDGRADAAWRAEGSPPRIARLVTYMPGLPLASAARLPEHAPALGRLAARLDRALQGFSHPASGHRIAWDLKHAGDLVDLLPHVDAGEPRALAEQALATFRAKVAPALPTLRAQVIHNDLNPHNILVEADAPERLCGIIDFGDMVHSALVNDPAIAAAYLAGGPGDAIGRMAAFIGAYHTVLALEEREIALLPALIATRHAMTLAITSWRAHRYPENRAYIVRNQGAALAGLAAFAAARHDAVAARFAAACRAGAPF